MNDCASPQNELLSGYLDGELQAEQAGRVEAHLQSCPSCAAELKSLRCAGRTLRDTIARQAEAADFSGFPERVQARIDESAGAAPAETAGTIHWLREHRSATLALAAAAILLLGLLLGPLLFPADAGAPGEADVVVELLDPPDGYDAMIFNEGDEGKNITVIWLFEQEADTDTDTDSSTEPAL